MRLLWLLLLLKRKKNTVYYLQVLVNCTAHLVPHTEALDREREKVSMLRLGVLLELRVGTDFSVSFFIGNFKTKN